jgi:hypothetical protein
MDEGVYNSYDIKHGGSCNIAMCPHCNLVTYDYELGMCVSCEESADHECKMCSNTIPPEELDDCGFCSYCNHMMNKDD